VITHRDLFDLADYVGKAIRPGTTEQREIDLSDPDPIGKAVAAGVAAGRGRGPFAGLNYAAIRRVRRNARVTRDYRQAAIELLVLLRHRPHAIELQEAIAHLFADSGDLTKAWAAWDGIARRYPNLANALVAKIALTRMQEGDEAARAMIAEQFPRRPQEFEPLIAYAKAHDLIGDEEEADAAYDELTQLFRDDKESWLAAATRLETKGRHWGAAAVLERGARYTRARPVRRKLSNMNALLANLTAVVPDARKRSQVTSISVLSRLFEEVLAERDISQRANGHALGSLAMLTGSLGSGGAERQLVNVAIGLSKMNGAGPRPVRGPIRVMARSLKTRVDARFFMPQLHEAGVPVTEIETLPQYGGNIATSSVRPYVSALKFLPYPVSNGAIRLTDYLRQLNPDVVQIWQDGMVYTSGLAALLAGVPRIILTLRTMPPVDRGSSNHPEYPVIYKSLLRAPGVTMSVNSRFAAERYGDWLGVDPAGIQVVHNGVELTTSTPDADAVERFRAFDARTSPAAITVGSVMRMDGNKRPLLWIDAAAKLLEKIPSARFILVGDGPLRGFAASHAQALGIASRILFAGRSTHVAYWLSKMDLFMLLSKHEGLPNVLIEAQMAGVPALTTPAGGAPETLIPGETGLVTPPAPDADAVAAMIVGLAENQSRLKDMGQKGREWATDAFSMDRMLSDTVDLFMRANERPAA